MLSRAYFLLLAGWLSIAGAAELPRLPLKSDAKIVVLIFVSSECPVSNKLAPEMERLSRKYSTNDVLLAFVYPNQSDTDESITAHRREYRLSGPFLRDPQREWVKASGVTVTPEAAVFDGKRELAYRGRITDQFLALGKGRPGPTRHDLEEAIDALLAGRKPKQPRIPAIGCYIQDR